MRSYIQRCCSIHDRDVDLSLVHVLVDEGPTSTRGSN